MTGPRPPLVRKQHTYNTHTAYLPSIHDLETKNARTHIAWNIIIPSTLYSACLWGLGGEVINNNPVKTKGQKVPDTIPTNDINKSIPFSISFPFPFAFAFLELMTDRLNANSEAKPKPSNPRSTAAPFPFPDKCTSPPIRLFS